jgi:hypothetical protein
MQQKRPVSVLVAPLDWGLGHATRCIPIIRELIRQGAQVTIASSGAQRNLLETEFPDLEFLDLPGYQIRYRQGIFLKWGLLFSIPVILRHIKRENRWLADILQTRKMDLVISDHRYGLYHRNIFSIFLAHQLSIRSGLGSFFDHILLKCNYGLIQKFSACWVPDWPGCISLAGSLSHPERIPPVPTIYIGILSRTKPLPELVRKNSLLILISGPEPQRGQFEKIIFSQLAQLTLKCTVVRGLPGSELPAPFISEEIDIVNHLPSAELNRLLHSSEMIITRSGYSSLMDLVQMGKSAILVPTPGQTEQEYLGRRLHQMNWMLTIRQEKFNLIRAINQWKASTFTQPPKNEPLLGVIVEESLLMIREKNHGPESPAVRQYPKA